MQFGKVNWIRDSFDGLKDEYGETFDFVSKTLTPIKESIRSAVSQQKHIQESFEELSQTEDNSRDEEWEASSDNLREDSINHSAFIEEMLGVSFVICQVYIKQTEQAFSALDKQVQRETNTTLSCLVRSQGNVRVLAQGSKIGQSQYTYAQIMNAAANYYKHRAEWDRDWTHLAKGQQQTADVVRALGAKSGLDDNLSKLARYLGNQNLVDVDEFLKGVRKWEFEIIKQIELELQQRQLL